MGYRPQCHKESDVTEQLSAHAKVRLSSVSSEERQGVKGRLPGTRSRSDPADPFTHPTLVLKATTLLNYSTLSHLLHSIGPERELTGHTRMQRGSLASLLLSKAVLSSFDSEFLYTF